MISISELINNLINLQVNFYLQNGQVQLKLPWPPDEAPKKAIPLLKKLKSNNIAILAHLEPVPPVGTYLKDIHGQPEVKDIKEWSMLFRQAMKAATVAGENKKWPEMARLQQDAAYFSSCTGYLKSADKKINSYKHIVESMQYANKFTRRSTR